MLPIYVGGCVRAAVEKKNGGEKAKDESDGGILAASGFVAGEGLAGVLIAGLAWQGVIPKSKPALLGGLPGEAAVLAVTALLCWTLWRAGRSGRTA